MSVRTKINRQQLIIPVFLLLWFLLNVLQAIFTELAHDEAYYWMYSRYPAWGYFDHPPMAAMLIRAGYALLQNELGVRIMFCLLGTATLWFTWKISEGSAKLFVMLVPAMVLVHTHVAGFLAIPDIPLVFFTALFFYFYKKYLERDSVQLALLLGLSVTGMLYSKYHGLLVVFFVWLSNLQLIRRRSAWIMAGMVALAMVPHLVWQILNSFPTFQYHLVTRSEGFDPENILNYLYSQLLIAGPLVAPLVLYFALSGKAGNPFERSLKFTLAGFLIFFFLSSFRDHIEAHWTAAAYVPMIVLAHRAVSRHPRASAWIRNLAVPSVVSLILLRSMLAFSLIPGFLKHLDEFNGWKTWAQEIKKTAGSAEVAFLNKYQFAAKYAFYTGDRVSSLNEVLARKSQYNLWNLDDALAGKRVLLYKSLKPTGTLPTPDGKAHGYSFIDSFQQVNRVILNPVTHPGKIRPNDTLVITYQICNPTGHPISLYKRIPDDLVLSYAIHGDRSVQFPLIPEMKGINTGLLKENECITMDLVIQAPDKPGKYSLYLVFSSPSAGMLGNVKPWFFKVE